MSKGQIFVFLVVISATSSQYPNQRGHNKWRENQSCDVTIRTLTAEITSPGYPNEYPPLTDCQYTILPSNEAICQVSINFIDFDVEESPNCHKDRLLIGQQPFCGRVKNYTTNKNLTTQLKLRFISDSGKNGRGFRLRLEQIHCGNTLKYQGYPGGQCCTRDYTHPYAILTSPGFLSTEWTESHCHYTIQPFSDNVCRLRFRFKHFWVGDEDVFYGCVNGFLEIDKRRFCGCMDGYEYVSNLDDTRRKEVWYSNRGPGNRGFVIEVFQEECQPFGNRTEFDPNTEIEVFMTNMTSEKAVSRFLIPRDDSRCTNWGHPEWTRSVESILRSAPCETLTASQFHPFPEQPEPFPTPFEPAFIPPVTPPPSVFIPPVTPPPSIFLPPRNCNMFRGYTGYFTSPNYPRRYPPGLRRCYMFFALPGFCRLELTFFDFNLEKSFRCWKDYLLIYDRHRYCGDYLRQSQITFYFDPNGIFSMEFVSDLCFSGRGFKGRYIQRPCSAPYAKFQSFPGTGNGSHFNSNNNLN